MATRRLPRIEIGDQVFAGEGSDEFGAVRFVQRDALIVHIENSGEHAIPLTAVTAVHDGKVILDIHQLPSDIRSAIEHAHDREQY